MARNDDAGNSPRILILGSTGRIGQAVIAALDQTPNSHQIVYAPRNRDHVETWQSEGKDAVYLDLDDPRTFALALRGVDRLYLATGYTIHMVHQSKTIVDAAADAGVKFIVHLGIFGNGRMTDPHFAWHEMVERYIECSGVSWSHIHPHFFMDNLLTTTPVVNGTFHWFMGDKRVGWIAGVAARVLAEGPEKHAPKQYWLSTEVLNGSEAAAEIAQGLQQQMECIVMTPDDLAALIASGAVQPPPNIEANYAASIIEWARQTYDGRMDFGAVTTTTAEELLGCKPLTLRTWVERSSRAVLEAGARAALAASTPTTI
jgi:NAD(P)H dehydrogenase (quinone)